MTMPAGNNALSPRIISWNVTLRCPLRCAHCYVNAGDREAKGVLSTDEAFAVIDQICELGKPVVILSGENRSCGTIFLKSPAMVPIKA